LLPTQIILKPIQSEVTKKKEDSTKFMASATIALSIVYSWEPVVN